MQQTVLGKVMAKQGISLSLPQECQGILPSLWHRLSNPK